MAAVLHKSFTICKPVKESNTISKTLQCRRSECPQGVHMYDPAAAHVTQSCQHNVVALCGFQAN